MWETDPCRHGLSETTAKFNLQIEVKSLFETLEGKMIERLLTITVFHVQVTELTNKQKFR